MQRYTVGQNRPIDASAFSIDSVSYLYRWSLERGSTVLSKSGGTNGTLWNRANLKKPPFLLYKTDYFTPKCSHQQQVLLSITGVGIFHVNP